MTERRYAIIEAPSVLGLKPTGVDRLPQALLDNRLAERVEARFVGRVEPLPYSGERDGATGTLNARAIAAWSPRLADAIGGVLDAGEFPLVLGGDCSILLGSMLALKRRGRFGLLFIDGHADFYQPAANPNGEAASMDLAFATGYGPALLTDLEQRGPLVRPADTVAFGFRDADEQRQYGSQPLATDILALDLAAARQMGVEQAAQAAVERLTRPELEGFFIHLDADCLDDRIMPAVDYRLPDGFSWSEVTSLLKVALASGRAVGMEVTIYNPALDEDGKAGRDLANVLAAALGTSAPSTLPGNGVHAPRASRHDFDFMHGSWNVHNRYLKGRLRHSTEWIEFDAQADVQPLLEGLGQLDRYRAVRDGNAIEGITLRLFNPATGEWALHWADTVNPGVLLPPMVGRFTGDVGEFFGDEFVDGKKVLCRFCWTRANAESPRWEQAFSDDGGKTWETNWIMTFTRR